MEGSAPKGRGKALLEYLRQKKEREAAEPTPGTSSEPAPAPITGKGRAAVLKKYLESKKAASVQLGTTSSIPPSSTAPPTPETTTEQTKEICQYQGVSGTPVALSTNFIKLIVEQGRGIFEYEVNFDPEVDAKAYRLRLVSQVFRELAIPRVFDGGNKLYLSEKITDSSRHFTGELSGQDIAITIIYKKQKSYGDSECLHLYNVLFKRIMGKLMYTEMGREHFNTHRPYLIPQYKLQVLPGYAVSVSELEDGLLLCLDTRHKVIRNESAYDFLQQIKSSTRPGEFKAKATLSLLGSTVATSYNYRTYIVDDIMWDMTPKDTFTTSTGRVINYMTYYKEQYKLDINDPDQPMLLHRRKYKDQEETLVCLVPEFCFMTGLADEARRDFRMMKEIAQHTRVSPQQRVHALRIYLENLNSNENARQILQEWGLSVAQSNVELEGRRLNMETLHFGSNKSAPIGISGNWTRLLAQYHVMAPVDLTDWTVFFTDRDKNCSHEFVRTMVHTGGTIGCHVGNPRMERLPDDRSPSLLQAMQKLKPTTQIAVFICSSQRTDRYSVIKKVCCSDLGIASQVILAKTISRPDKIREMVLHIALQMNCKLGGSLWTVQFPFKNWMICGMDVYHKRGDPSMNGFVASINESMSRWFSIAVAQEKEIGNTMATCFAKAIEAYKNANGTYPVKVVILRDGVGDGQFDHVRNYEIPQFEEALRQFCPATALSYVIVQKRHSARIFGNEERGTMNPGVGVILDHGITRKYLYDFYLVSQNPSQGTATPTHYVVLHNGCNIKPDHLQRLCYKLCHMYYNHPSTIKVPAPCHYAHRLAGMVGQYIKAPTLPQLADKLYFL